MIKVLFHSYGANHCPDGFAAAYSAWRKYGDAAKYIPVEYQSGEEQYRQYLSEVGQWDKEDEVYILDWSAPRAVLQEIKTLVRSLVVLDHHKTAQEQLLGLDFALFEMKKSGAMLSWEYFNPDSEIPALIKYVQDRDLWTKALPATEEMHLALGSFRQSFEVWNVLASLSIKDYCALMVQIGRPLLQAKESKIAAWIKKAKWINLAGHKILGLEVEDFSLISDGLNKLCKENSSTPFAAAWYIQEGQKVWSLRSLGVDVGEIAKSYGGGGHSKAAGFKESEE